MNPIELNSLKHGKMYYIELKFNNDKLKTKKYIASFMNDDYNYGFYNIVQIEKDNKKININDENHIYAINYLSKKNCKFYEVKKNKIQENMEIRAIEKVIRKVTGEQYYHYLSLI